MNSRRLIAPLAVAAFAMHVAGALAQGAFPAPLPGQAGTVNDPAFPPVNGAPASRAPANASPFPPVNGAQSAPTPFPSGGAAPLGAGFGPPPQQQAGPPGGEDCMKGFMPLRAEAEKRGNAIKAASERHAPPDEACKLITAFAQSEIKMLNYVKANKTKCGIPDNVGAQMATGHKNTEGMRMKVCAVAQQQRNGGGPAAAPRLSDVLGSSASLPDNASARKSGGTTFDTLNGNVLTR